MKDARREFISYCVMSANAQNVDPDETVAEEQQAVEEPTVVLATQEPDVIANPGALHPTFVLNYVVQDVVVPALAQEVCMIVAVTPEQF